MYQLRGAPTEKTFSKGSWLIVTQFRLDCLTNPTIGCEELEVTDACAEYRNTEGTRS